MDINRRRDTLTHPQPWHPIYGHDEGAIANRPVFSLNSKKAILLFIYSSLIYEKQFWRIRNIRPEIRAKNY